MKHVLNALCKVIGPNVHILQNIPIYTKYIGLRDWWHGRVGEGGGEGTNVDTLSYNVHIV